MEIYYCGADILKVGRFLGAVRYIVSNPVHKVLEFAATLSGIEDRIILELGHPVHLDGERGLHDSVGERFGHMRLQ